VPLPNCFRRLLRDARGAVTILAAAGLLLAMGAGAIAVDLGSVFYESRRLQGVADSAALAAAGNIGTASASAQSAIRSANWARTIAPAVTTGVWSPDSSVAASARFVAGGSSPNAARVSVTMDSPLYFGRVFGLRTVRLGRTATATRIDLASFSIGSRLLSLDGGLANQLLSGLTGSSVSLTLADYNALASADVDLLGFTSALKTELGLTAGSFSDTLKVSTNLTTVLTALSKTLQATGNSGAVAAVNKLVNSVPGTQINLSQLLDLGPVGKQDYVLPGQSINVNALDMVRTSLQTAGGARQVQLNLNSLLPGLASANLTLAMGDRVQSSPWIAVTRTGTPIVSTAQTRLYIDTSILSSPALQFLGIGAVRLPVYVELAPAQAKLSSLSCTATDRSASLLVQTSIGHVSIADVATAGLTDMTSTPTENPATIVNLLGLKVYGSARTDLSSGGWQTVNFNSSEIAARTTKTVSSSGVLTAITSSLLGKLNLTVQAGPFGLSTAILSPLLTPLLSTVGALLDPVLQNLLNLLGIHLGQADVRMNGVRCGTAALVA
jgi:uncharacterized membrane protein